MYVVLGPLWGCLVTHDEYFQGTFHEDHVVWFVSYRFMWAEDFLPFVAPLLHGVGV